MRGRKGFISIISLIVMSVSMIMILYLEHTTSMGSLILNSTTNNIQSYYLAEGKIYMTLHDDKYYLNQLYPALAEYFRTLPFSKQPKDIIIYKEDLITGDDVDKVKINLIDNGNKKQLRLISKSNFKGLRTTVTSHITVFNELLEMEYPILDVDFLEDKYKEDLIDLLLNISNNISLDNLNASQNIYSTELMNFSTIILDKKDNINFKICSYRETMLEPYIETFSNKEIFAIIRKFEEKPTNLIIRNSYNPNEIIKLSGIIYVEGDIKISNQFEFNGIMIVKNGEIIVDDNLRPNIKGIIIVDNAVYNDFMQKADIIYSRHSVYKYGTYLPGVIKPTIELIKSD